VKVGNLYAFGDRHVLVAAMDALRATVGLPADPDATMLFRYCHFLTEPPGLQSAGEILPQTTVRLRHVVFDQSGREAPPDWLDDLTAHPTVYATAGTGFNRTPGLLESFFAALRDEPINLILTVGRDRDPASFGRQPSNVHIERYIPQSMVFGVCDLVVSHGGTGTMLAALHYGLPMVNVSIAADQPENAARCVELGLGVTVDSEHRTPAAIRAAVRSVLAEPNYRRRAQRLGAEMRAMPPLERGVQILERLNANP
jgi:MGT family glycosyltransferase